MQQEVNHRQFTCSRGVRVAMDQLSSSLDGDSLGISLKNCGSVLDHGDVWSSCASPRMYQKIVEIVSKEFASTFLGPRTVSNGYRKGVKRQSKMYVPPTPVPERDQNSIKQRKLSTRHVCFTNCLWNLLLTFSTSPFPPTSPHSQSCFPPAIRTHLTFITPPPWPCTHCFGWLNGPFPAPLHPPTHSTKPVT